MPDTKILLVGCGKMGGAILQRAASSATTYVVEPAGLPEHLKKLSNVTAVAAPDKIDPAFKPDIILLAIKPQQMASALPAYSHYTNCVFLSIAAGFSTTSIETALKNNPAVVRSMPNLPASVGQGMTVATANKNVTTAQKDLCDRLLKTVGETEWVNNENLLDAVTALSGSGPAYVFALCEAMAKAGVSLGLSPDLSEKLARQTVIGSGLLLTHSKDSAEKLRTAVTSPGGTTEAALKYLLASDGLMPLMQKAMAAALQRAKELAKLS